jgi:peptidoglycan/xylan/chitin deacetylase (PgdA/CDA1 family)
MGMRTTPAVGAGDERPARRELFRLAGAAAGAAALGIAGHGAARACDRNALSGGLPEARPPVTGALAGHEIRSLPGVGQKVMLTFDCGGDAGGAEEVLATLQARRVPATFFMTGRFALDNPALARRIGRRYPVGNHSMTHPSFPGITLQQRAEEVRLAAEIIEEEIGRPSDPLFRFPFGRATRACIAEVNTAGYVPVRWTVDTQGWKGTVGGASTTTVVDRTLRDLRPGAIVLMHVGATPEDQSAVDATALPALIDAISARGYGFTTLRDMFTAP